MQEKTNRQQYLNRRYQLALEKHLSLLPPNLSSEEKKHALQTFLAQKAEQDRLSLRNALLRKIRFAHGQKFAAVKAYFTQRDSYKLEIVRSLLQ